MNRSSKLLLTAIVFVGSAMALAFFLQPDVVKEDLPAPRGGNGRMLQKLTELQAAPGELPEAARQVETYLQDRWSEFDDEGIVAAGVETGGERFFVSKQAIVGMRGDGSPLYARSIMRAHKYEGPVFKFNNSPLKTATVAVMPDAPKGNFASRLPKGKAGKIPLDQIPGAEWGELSKLPDQKD